MCFVSSSQSDLILAIQKRKKINELPKSSSALKTKKSAAGVILSPRPKKLQMGSSW